MHWQQGSDLHSLLYVDMHKHMLALIHLGIYIKTKSNVNQINITPSRHILIMKINQFE